MTADQMEMLVRMARYAVVPDISYRTVDGWTGKLDVMTPRNAAGPNPTLIYYHGGGWWTGSKEERVPLLLPYMAMGWTIINVEYRLKHVALAPAAAQDARCALWWVYRNAGRSIDTSSGPVALNIDPDRIITSGTSAGGHLALLTAMAPRTAGLDEGCENAAPGQGEPRVAAVIDWFGISDVFDLFKDAKANSPGLASSWLGDGPGWQQTARLVSPINYVRAGLPPIISIHGDSDPIVPFAQKMALHEAIDAAGSPHQLVTIKGGGHGLFPEQDMVSAYGEMESFLKKHDLLR